MAAIWAGRPARLSNYGKESDDVGRRLMWCVLAAQLGAGIGHFPATQDGPPALHMQGSQRPPDLSHMTLADLINRLSDLESAEGGSHPDLIPVLERIANAYRKQGAYVEALAFVRRALDIALEAYGENDRETVILLDALGTLDCLAGENNAAIKNYELARSIVEKYLGKGAPIHALLLLHLGTAYLADGMFEEAEHALKETKPALVSAFGSASLEATTADKELGALYLKMGKYSKAEKALEEAFAIRSEWLSRRPDGMSEADVRVYMARVQVPLGALYTAIGRYGEAHHWLLGALQAFEENLGADHPEVEEALVNLAVLTAARGDTAEADSFQRRAESIHQQNLGISHFANVPLPQPIRRVHASANTGPDR
jgi:tetratricopeptide (TPR) repeat protein